MQVVQNHDETPRDDALQSYVSVRGQYHVFQREIYGEGGFGYGIRYCLSDNGRVGVQLEEFACSTSDEDLHLRYLLRENAVGGCLNVQPNRN